VTPHPHGLTSGTSALSLVVTVTVTVTVTIPRAAVSLSDVAAGWSRPWAWPLEGGVGEASGPTRMASQLPSSCGRSFAPHRHLAPHGIDDEARKLGEVVGGANDARH
jgi:hypothetical protein